MEVYVNLGKAVLKTPLTRKNIVLQQPDGTFKVSPASKALMNAIEQNHDKLNGIGIDWGCGNGCQAILASMLCKNVEKIYALELLEENVETSKQNVIRNHLEDKITVYKADSYQPMNSKEYKQFQREKHKVAFILANPPSSNNDDGLGFRRRVLKEGREYLVEGGMVFLNISFQYGRKRIANFINEIEGYKSCGVIYSSEESEFDLRRQDLLQCIKTYVDNEKKTEIEYEFIYKGIDGFLNANEAYSKYQKTGEMPLTRWQTYLFIAT